MLPELGAVPVTGVPAFGSLLVIDGTASLKSSNPRLRRQ
jgi:hypothetical protein